MRQFISDPVRTAKAGKKITTFETAIPARREAHDIPNDRNSQAKEPVGSGQVN